MDLLGARQLLLEDVEIDNNGGIAVVQDASDEPVYRRLRIHDNGQDVVKVDGGYIRGNVVWDGTSSGTGVPFMATGNLTVDAGAVLTVTAGSEVRFVQATSLYVQGTLIAEGTATAPITFTNAVTDVAQPGVWYGVRFTAGARGRLAYCAIDSAGYGGWAALDVSRSDVEVRNCRIHDNQDEGVSIQDTSPLLQRNVIAFNSVGLRARNATPTLQGNVFYRNGIGVQNDTPTVLVDARYNAWGHPSGPYHPTANIAGLGDPVSDGVLFEPWNRFAGLQAPDNEPPQAGIVVPAMDGFTFDTLPIRFQVRLTDTDTMTETLFVRAEIWQGATRIAVFDQLSGQGATGWDLANYLETGEPVTATLALTRSLPTGTYTLRVMPYDHFDAGLPAERTFQVDITTWGVASVEPATLLATPNQTQTLTIHGAGFQNDVQVWFEMRLISETVRLQPAAVRVVSADLIEVDVNLENRSGPWDVVISQGGEERRTRITVVPYLPVMALDYERSFAFTPGRWWTHRLLVRNVGSAAGVAIVALRPPTGTLVVGTTANATYLGRFASPYGNVHFVAVEVAPGERQDVGVTYQLPWSAVGGANALDLGDPIDFGYYLLGQPIVDVWDDIQAIAQEGNDGDPEAYLDDLLTLSLWASGYQTGWVLDTFRALPDDASSDEYLMQVGSQYPYVADVLAVGIYNELYDAIETQTDALGMTRASNAAAPDMAYATAGIIPNVVRSVREWIYFQTGGDVAGVIRRTFSGEETWETIRSGSAAVFLLGEIEGFVEGVVGGVVGTVTFGMVNLDLDVNLGSKWLAQQLCLPSDLVKAARFTGSVLSIPVGSKVEAFAAKGAGKMVVMGTQKVSQAFRLPQRTQAKMGKVMLAYNRTDEPAKFSVVYKADNARPQELVQFVVDKDGNVRYGTLVTLRTKRGDVQVHLFNDAQKLVVNGRDLTKVYDNIKTVKETAEDISGRFDKYFGKVEPKRTGDGRCDERLRGAFDPNEIKSAPEADFVPPEQALDVTVYFENLPTATDPAERVEITMTLPPALDLDTIQVTGSSHQMQPSLDRDTGTLRFIFDGINLPPNQNPPEGEGWVRFSIEPRTDLPSGTQIPLQADIVFWAFGAPNPPIRTNTITYTIDSGTPNVTLQSIQADGKDVVLTVNAQDETNGSGVAALTVEYSRDGVTWFLGEGVTLEPPQHSVTRTVRFRPTAGGDLSVRVWVEDAVGHSSSESLSSAVQVPYVVHLPFILR